MRRSPFRALQRSRFRASQGVVADTTFSFRAIPWLTSEGETYDYQCIVAAPPEHHRLPEAERLHFALIPSLDLSTAGKEDLRPLAKELSDLGHWSYLLEWPGWTMDGAINWALHRCKLEHLREEYEDFWLDILSAVKPEEKEFRVLAAGDLAASIVSQPCTELKFPLRKLAATPGYTQRWSPRWNSYLSEQLEADGRLGRMMQRYYFSATRVPKLRQRILKHDGVTPHMLDIRHRRPRPLTHTDMALICGYLDIERDVPQIDTIADALLSPHTWEEENRPSSES